MPIDQKNADRAISYHGPALIDQLAREEADVRLPSFLALPQAGTKKEPRRDPEFDDTLVTFIAKKADLLFKKYESDVQKDVKDCSEVPDLYAIVPPLEAYLEVSEDQRLEHFFSCIDVGDIVVGQVESVHDGGLQAYLLCFFNKKARDIDTLRISAFCPTREIPLQYKHNDLMESFKKKDKVCAVVVNVVQATEKIAISLRSDRLPPNCKGVALGHIEDQDLPIHYRRLQRLDGATYNEHVQRRLGFSNASNIATLCSSLGIEAGARPSLLRTFHGRSFPKEDCAEQLRKIQSRNWAMKSVTEGVSLCKQGKYTEAIQYLNKALKIDEENVEAYVARGALYANNESYSRALEDFKLALEFDPNHKNAQKYSIQTLMMYARTLIDTGDDEAAIRQLEDALKLDPSIKEARNAISKLQAKLTASQQDSVIKVDQDVEERGNQEKMKDARADPDGSEVDGNEKTTETLRRLLKEEKLSKAKKKKRRSRSSPDSRSPDPSDGAHLQDSTSSLHSSKSATRQAGEDMEETRKRGRESSYYKDNDSRSRPKDQHLSSTTNRHSSGGGAGTESRSSASRHTDSGYTDDRARARYDADSDNSRSYDDHADDYRSRSRHRSRDDDSYNKSEKYGNQRKSNYGERSPYEDTSEQPEMRSSRGGERGFSKDDMDDRASMRRDNYVDSPNGNNSSYARQTQKKVSRRYSSPFDKIGGEKDEEDVDDYLYGGSDDRKRSPPPPRKVEHIGRGRYDSPEQSMSRSYDWDDLETGASARRSPAQRMIRNYEDDEDLFREKRERSSDRDRATSSTGVGRRTFTGSPGLSQSDIVTLEFRIGEQIRLEQERIGREMEGTHKEAKDDMFDLGKYDLDLRQSSYPGANRERSEHVDTKNSDKPSDGRYIVNSDEEKSQEKYFEQTGQGIQVIQGNGKWKAAPNSTESKTEPTGKTLETKWKPVSQIVERNWKPLSESVPFEKDRLSGEVKDIRISIQNDYIKSSKSDTFAPDQKPSPSKNETLAADQKRNKIDENGGGKVSSEEGALVKGKGEHAQLYVRPNKRRRSSSSSSSSSGMEKKHSKRRRSRDSRSRSRSKRTSKGRKRSRSHSRRRSRSRSRDRKQSRSRSRGRKRSRSRSRGRKQSRSKSRGRKRSRSRSHDRKRSRSRSRDRKRSRSKSRSRRQSKSRSRSRRRSRSRSRSRRRHSRKRMVTRCVRKGSKESSSSSSSSSSRSSSSSSSTSSSSSSRSGPLPGRKRGTSSSRRSEKPDDTEKKIIPFAVFDKSKYYQKDNEPKISGRKVANVSGGGGKSPNKNKPIPPLMSLMTKSIPLPPTKSISHNKPPSDPDVLKYGKWDSPQTMPARKQKGKKGETLDEMESFLKKLKDQKKSTNVYTSTVKQPYKKW